MSEERVYVAPKQRDHGKVVSAMLGCLIYLIMLIPAALIVAVMNLGVPQQDLELMITRIASYPITLGIAAVLMHKVLPKLDLNANAASWGVFYFLVAITISSILAAYMLNYADFAVENLIGFLISTVIAYFMVKDL